MGSSVGIVDSLIGDHAVGSPGAGRNLWPRLWWRPSLGVAMLVVALLTAGGCASGSDVIAGDAVIPASGEYLSLPSSTFGLVAGTEVRLGVVDGNLAVSAGCNNLGGAYRLDGSTLVVDEMMMTQMACADDLMDQDARLAALLTGRPEVAASSDGFTLSASNGITLVMVDRSVVEPDLSVEGTVWVLNSVITGDTATSAVGFDSVQLTLADGTMTVVTACSSGTAPYAPADDGTYVFGPVAISSTVGPGDPSHVDCIGSAVAEAEEALAAVLDGPVAVSVEGSALTLAGDDMSVVLLGQ